MGKSPGKWIKTVIFGKKTTKSNIARGKERLANGKEVHVTVMTPETGIDDNPQEVPSGGLDAVHVDKQNSASEYREASVIQQDQEILAHGDRDADVQQIRELDMLTAEEKIEQEKATTKIQAALRGYLARRAFKALKGIIRLQALIRGHLVRRQAVATLRCVIGIVKLQALVRGSRIRCSDAGIQVQRVCIVNPLDVTTSFHGDVVSTSTASLSVNALIRKLLAPSPEGMPLCVQYDETDSNSVQTWLERWSVSCPWIPVSPPKKATNSKIQKKQAVEAEIGRPKRGVRKVTSLSDNASAHSTLEFEKPRRNPKKVSSHPADSAQDNPQNELEKVKRSLRKVQNPVAESSAPAETITSSVQEVPDPSEVNLVENIKDETVFILKEEAMLTVPKENDQECSEDPIQTSQSIEISNDSIEIPSDEITKVKLGSFEGNEKDDVDPVSNGDLKPPLAFISPSENQKFSRRASFSVKQEHEEDGLQSTPKVPSYMQATQSAKAKLRGQGPAKLGQESSEKNNVTRRHSLSSPANGKVSSVSPRTPKILQGSGKGGSKSDKSMLSSRDGNALTGKATQEWRR